MGDELTSMNISLPREMRSYVQRQLRAGGYSNASEFVRQLIRAEQARSRKQLRAMLLKGLASGPAEEATDAYWKRLDRRAHGRAGTPATKRRKAG